MTTFQEFVQKHNGITLDPVVQQAIRPYKDERPYDHVVTLRHRDKLLTIKYSMGCGLLEKQSGSASANTGMFFGSGKWRPCSRPIQLRTVHDVEQFQHHYRPQLPDLADILQSLCLDADALVNHYTFEDWASEFGYDEDSIKAKAIYDQCIKQSRELQQLLGLTLFNELIKCTED